MTLKEWTRIFVKHRDLVKREIVHMEETTSGFVLTKKTGTETVAVQEHLDATQLADVIITLNSEKNVEELVTHWKTYVTANPFFVFANPSTNEKWLLRPHFHDRVADEKSLKLGLMSMCESITKC